MTTLRKITQNLSEMKELLELLQHRGLETTDQRAVRKVGGLVEKAIRTLPTEVKRGFFDKQDRFYFSRLSVFHESFLRAEEGEDNNDFIHMCSDLVFTLSRVLNYAGISHAKNNSPLHTSLTIKRDGVDVYVDPSIGQYVRGFNKIFVGTKQDLIALVTNSHQRGNLINLEYYVNEGELSPNSTPEKIIEMCWGQPRNKDQL